MEIIYMSWLRNRVGKGRETITPPQEVDSVQKLMDWLTQQSAEHKALFSYSSIISVAVNGKIVLDLQSPITASDQVSFFSPMAGG